MQLPLREVHDRYTKSELAMLAWRSQEQYWNLKARIDSPRTLEGEEWAPYISEDLQAEDGSVDVDAVHEKLAQQFATKRKLAKKEPVKKSGKKRRKQYAGRVPENLPDRFYNKDGEVDLSQVTGAEALKYFQLQGIKVPVIQKYDR